MLSKSPVLSRLLAVLLASGIGSAGLAAEPSSVPAGSTPAVSPAPPVNASTQVTEPALPSAEVTEKIPDSPHLLLDGPPTGALPTPAPAAPSPNATINLIRILVAKKILSEDEAKQMIEQAEMEAASARIVAEEVKNGGAADVSVTYVPDVVKNDLREQIRADLQADARAHGWTTDNKVAEWTQRISMFGDFRMRFEADLYPEGNNNTGAFPNFNAINTGSPFDVAGTQFSPQYNVDQERNRFKVRARIGWDVNLEDGWSAGFRLATGENNSPVTANQGLGVANQGQGGNFSKFAIWLDRAFLKYEAHGSSADAEVLFGRFDNPFMATSIIWQDEIGFDGLAFKGKAEVFDGVRAFFTGGMFPIFNTDLNFASNQPSKFKSTDKYLYAAQLGADFKITKQINAKVAAAYYDFDGVEGKLSTPFIPLTSQDQGDTDNTRPSFAQKGNTYRPLRNIIPSVINNFGTSNQYQYFGLASKFKVAKVTGRIDFNNWEPYQLSFIGDYVQNTAFDKTAIDAVAVNNRGVTTPANPNGAFEGDNKAWLLRTQFGKAAFEKAGDWNISADYRYVGSDAVVDGFNDNDFGGGGTNVEGFTIGGSVALSKKTRLGMRWFSATQIAGPQFKSDIFMIDINAKF